MEQTRSICGHRVTVSYNVDKTISAIEKKQTSDAGGWLINFEQIEDSTRKNYFSRMPQEAQLLKVFPDAFVINRPKGSVGNDGYWFHEKPPYAYLAMYTCAGEGHLASMMTRIYSTALKRMVDDYKIEFTGSILQFLHKEVESRFRDKDNILLSTKANVAILRYHPESRIMEFAGANMHLFQVTGGQVNIIMGNDHQVGESKDNKLGYNSIEVDLSKPSIFYMFSSGVTNLIGGPDYKRLSLNDLKEFLLKHHRLSIFEQKSKLEDFLLHWTGTNRQNDDILVLGFWL
jgi:hypothetical protein